MSFLNSYLSDSYFLFHVFDFSVSRTSAGHLRRGWECPERNSVNMECLQIHPNVHCRRSFTLHECKYIQSEASGRINSQVLCHTSSKDPTYTWW